MKTTITYQGGMRFLAESGSGHEVLMDSSPDFGGENKGPRPMEMLLMGLGGCTAIDVVLILQKGRQDVSDCRVEVTAERSESVPKVFTRIHVHFIVSGRDLSEKRVARAVELSATKYCSASLMLGKTAEITHDYQIVVK
ncbi:MAG: OsmC family protein [Pseudomonadota bacterium]|nr:OsmC family protein [Pseudomonadota bacterium]